MAVFSIRHAFLSLLDIDPISKPFSKPTESAAINANHSSCHDSKELILAATSNDEKIAKKPSEA